VGRRNGSDRGPLRKIVGYCSHLLVPGEYAMEVLECGHVNRPRHDAFGVTHAARRRCPKCRRGDPPDVTPQTRKTP
jgi:hypothetical protein